MLHVWSKWAEGSAIHSYTVIQYWGSTLIQSHDLQQKYDDLYADS